MSKKESSFPDSISEPSQPSDWYFVALSLWAAEPIEATDELRPWSLSDSDEELGLEFSSGESDGDSTERT